MERWQILHTKIILSKKSPTGPTERPPNPEYLIALVILLRGPLVISYSIFDEF